MLPGTALVELALQAGRVAGLSTVEDLTIEAPLLLGDGLDVQLRVDPAGAFELHARAGRRPRRGVDPARHRHPVR